MATQEDIDQLLATQAKVQKLFDEAKATDARIAQGIQELNAAKLKREMEPIQYTLFASGLTHGGQGTYLEGKNLTNDLAVLFDVVEQHSFMKKAEKTSYAIESRAKASDHVVINDGSFTFSARISDSPQYLNPKNIIDKDTDKDNPLSSKRPAKSLEILSQIMDNRELITLVTEDNILTNYVITSITATRQTSDGGALVYEIEIQEFRTVELGRTVFARADPRKAKNKNKGAKQTADGGPVADEAQGKKAPFNSKFKGWFTRQVEAKTGIKYDLNADGSKIIRPDNKFNPASLQR